MAPKRKNRHKLTERNKFVSTVSAVKIDPNNVLSLSEISSWNLSDEVAAAFVASYNFACFGMTVGMFNKKQEKELNNLVSNINKLSFEIQKSKHERFSDVIGLAQVFYYVTYTYLCSNLENNFSLAASLISRSLTLLNEHQLDPEVFMTYLRIAEISSSVWNKLAKFSKTYEISNNALEFFMKYMDEVFCDHLPTDLLFVTDTLNEDDDWSISNKLHNIGSLIFKHLTVACRSEGMTESNKLTILKYEHVLLKQKLFSLLNHDKMHEVIESSLNLSKTLLQYDRFTEARDHIALACFMLNITQENYREFDLSCLKCRCLLIQRNLMWAAYGISLIQSSNRCLLAQDKNSSFPKNVKLKSSSKFVETPLLLFTKNVDDLKPYTSLITDKLVFDYNNIKDIVFFILQHIKAVAILNSGIQENIFQVKTILHLIDVCKYFINYEMEFASQFNIYLCQRDYLEYFNTLLQTSHKKSIAMSRIFFLKNVTYYCNLYEFMSEFNDQFDINFELGCPSLSKSYYEENRTSVAKNISKHLKDYIRSFI